MAFPASSQIPADAYAKVKRMLFAIDQQAVDAIAFLANNTVSANYILDIYTAAGSNYSELDAAKTVPGIATYAEQQEDGFTAAQLGTEFDNVLAALQTVMNRIRNDFPKDVDGYVLIRKFETDGGGDATGGFTVRTFTPAQTANLRTDLQALADAIA